MANHNITTLEDALAALGAEHPFRSSGELSQRGIAAYDTLREILIYMESQQVISNFDEDKLDEICNDKF